MTAAATMARIEIPAVTGPAPRGWMERLALMLRLRRHRRAVMDLAYTDDRLLADIGLSRLDVTDALALPSQVDVSRHLQLIARRRHRSGGLV